MTYFLHNAKKGHLLNFFRKCPQSVDKVALGCESQSHFVYGLRTHILVI